MKTRRKSVSRDSVIQLLQNAKQPMDVEKIRVACRYGNWLSALKHCLELQYEGKIQGTKTSKSWVFYISKTRQFFGNPAQDSDQHG